MSIIIQQPDALSFSGNLKKFGVTSEKQVVFSLHKGAALILSEKYQPDAAHYVSVDVHTIIDKILSVTLPGTNLITEQSSGFADFTATIDGTAVAFRVIKGGVLELGSMAGDFVNEHFLTWQIQNKLILQHQPEWLTIYTNAARNLKAKAYYQDNTNTSMLLTALAAGKLLAVDVSWASINALFVKKNPIAWEVWFEDLAGTRLSYVQRYCLRNSDDEEKIFIWANTMGGIDSISLTGSAEDDKKLEHLIAEMGDESLQEYQTDKKREIKQSTGFLTVDESRWIEDFFYSGRRYLVGEDGAVRPIVLASSKVVGSTADDLFDYEFNYRLASESQLLNLERSFDSLPALEVPVDFFLTELLSGLPVAQYSDGLLMAVQSPFAQAWQKLSMAQLWGSALPGLVDGTTISVVNGKLQVNGVSGGVGVSKWGDLTEKPFSSLSNLFTVSPEGVLTLANTYALLHTHPYLSDADARIANWNNAFTWGNHATAGYAAAHTHPYRPDTWVPTWAEVSAKPVWTDKMGWDGTAVTVSTDMHIIGKLVVDGTIQFFGAGAGGTGGGGASALWELTDVADDMVNSIYGDIPMYNGTHFARYNISNFATVGHGHTIAQVTGLQSALDAKQPLLGYTPYYSANFVAGVNYSAPHSHPYLSDSDARIANWSTAFGWGNHAGLYRPIGYVPNWGEITSKPTWTEKFGWDGSAVTVSTDVHITGKLVVDGTIQFFGAGGTGGGGGGSSTLWGLSDVSDDVANAVYGDLIMYNGTHFARINQSVLAPAVHSHAIGQVTGLQGALDGKQASGSYVLNSDGRLSDSRVASDVYTWAKAASKPSYTKAEVGLSLVDNTADASKSVAYAANSGLLNGRSDYSLTSHSHNILYSKYNYEGGFTIPETTTATTLSEPSNLTVAMMSLTSTDGTRIFGSYATVLNYSGYNKYGSTQIGVRYDGTNETHKIAFRNFNQALNGYNNWCEIWNTDNLNRSDVPLFGSTGYFESSVRASHFVGASIRNNAEIVFATIDGGSYQSIRALNYYGLGSLAVLGTGYFEGKLTVQVPAGGVSASFTDNTYSTLKIKHPSLGVTQLINGYDVAWLTENAGNATFSGSVTSAGQITSVGGNSGQWNAAFSHSVRIDNPHVVTATQVGLGNVTNESKMTMFTNPVFTGSATAPTFYGALSGNATTASSTPQLTPLGQYVWNASSLPQSFNTGIQCSFVSGTEGFPSFGSVLNMAAYGGGGSAMQMFVPYSPSYGGYSLKVRFGNYDVNIGNSWTDWKTLLYNGYPEAVTFGSNLIVGGTIQFYTASDRRLKTDFETIINPIEKIKSLTGYFFNYTDQAMMLGGYTSRRDIGLIAQDVNAILPEATGKLWNTDFMGYKADKLIPLLVEAIKQQQNEIDQLKRQIAA